MIDNVRSQLIDNIRIAVSQKQDRTEILRAAVELIDAFSDDFNWTGAYLLDGDVLRVGPFVGPDTPHKVIKLNSGLCGAAATQKQTILVDDVKSDSRFLACSVNTRSEIVVPLLDQENVLGEIDIDSNKPGNFTADDRVMLEQIAQVIVDRFKQL